MPKPIRVMVTRKVYLRPIMSPRRPKISGAERADREARGEGEQREDEADIRRHVGEEVLAPRNAPSVP